MSEEREQRPAWAEENRRIQAYLPSKELKDEFSKDAEEHGGVSGFVTYLYRRFKREEAAKAEQNKAA